MAEFLIKSTATWPYHNDRHDEPRGGVVVSVARGLGHHTVHIQKPGDRFPRSSAPVVTTGMANRAAIAAFNRVAHESLARLDRQGLI